MNDLPLIVSETPEWALLRKPHGMPSAPLSENETGTLMSWFLSDHPDFRVVRGRKPIECGLVHRLDTGTEGLVLVAKTQHAYDFLLESQQEGNIIKTYFAYCSVLPEKKILSSQSLPFLMKSRFRAFGPGRREVRPLFPGMRGYDEAKTDYETMIESAEFSDDGFCTISCTLKRGFRHQVRVHLAWLGFPIVGDRLYNPKYRSDGAADNESVGDSPLELHAIGIRFIDPVSLRQVSFLLPRPDRKTR